MTDTLKFVRADATPHRDGVRYRGDEPRLLNCAVSLDGDPRPDRVQAIVLGVSDDRGVQLAGGRVGAVDGPLRVRDYLLRMPAPEGFAIGSLLNAGDLQSAEHTAETHARLAEVVAVLRERFPLARLVVVGGGQDHAYGEVLGLARSVGRTHPQGRLAVVSVGAQAQVLGPAPERAEPNANTAFRRLLLEPAARLDGPSLLQWGLQRSCNSASQLRFLVAQGVQQVYWDDIDGDHRRAGHDLVARMVDLADGHAGVSLSVHLGAFDHATSPGVGAPSVVGVPAGAVLRAASALASLGVATQLGIYELNPRFDQDGASARLAARIAWSYLTGTI